MLLASAELDHVWDLDCMCDMMYDGRAFQTLNVIGESNREALRIDRQAAGRNCHCSALISDGRVQRLAIREQGTIAPCGGMLFTALDTATVLYKTLPPPISFEERRHICLPVTPDGPLRSGLQRPS